MSLSHSTRNTLASICFFLGSVWSFAGAFKLIFGIRITFLLLPHIDLERVSPLPALAVSVVCFALGALLKRTPATQLDRTDVESRESRNAMLYGGEPASPMPASRTPITTRPPSA